LSSSTPNSGFVSPGADPLPDLSKVIPVTGTIGSGKSTFCGILEEAGAKVVSADKLAHVALTNLQNEIVKQFGAEIITNGTIDRSKLGKIVFADELKRKQLEALVHPEIRRLALIEFKHLLDSPTEPIKHVFYEVPLFFETGMQQLGFGPAVLITVRSDEAAVERITARGRETADQARARIAAQMPVDEKIALADIVIENDGDRQKLRDEADQLLKQLDLTGLKRISADNHYQRHSTNPVPDQ
jgi:dephospho-CoA kinase